MSDFMSTFSISASDCEVDADMTDEDTKNGGASEEWRANEAVVRRER
jgi:hypothetical protein